MRILLVLISIVSIIACQNQESHNVVENESFDEVSEALNGNLIINEPQLFEEDSEPEFINYPSENEDNMSLSSDLLITDMMHSGEEASNIDSKDWFGLFSHDDSIYTLKRVIPKVEKVFDMVMDDEGGDSTGVLVSVEEPEEAIILFSCEKDYLDDTLNYAKSVPNEILVNTSYEFYFGGNSYRLSATGEQNQLIDGWNGTRHYRLFIDEIGADSTVVRHTLLVAKEYFDDSAVKILFIGDIDNDNKIDLLLDVSRHYNLFEPVLYMSSGRSTTDVLKVVGMSSYSGC